MLQHVVTASTLTLLTVSVSGSTGTDTHPVATVRINELIHQYWEQIGLQPSPKATESEWCRRLYLHILGRIPTVEELQAFLHDRGNTKRHRLVQTLLHDEQYTSEYARHWTTIWTNLLIGRNGGSERNSRVSREGMQKYLRDVFAENRTYDRIVMDLVTAEGESAPGTKNFNGAVNFLAMKLNEKAVLASAETAKLFLGKQLQCTQCHNHPFNSWKQNQFWELSAFFRQATALRRYEPGTRNIRYIELTDQDFPGEGSPPTPEEAEVYYELRQAKLMSVYPVFIDGTELSNRSGYVEDVHRRRELGRMIVRSKEMPRAIVNRMWGHFFTYGFTTPVDDMGPHNAPSHPELLDYLANEFSEHSHDLKQLITWIVLSEPYSLSSQAAKGNVSDDPTQGERPMFSHFYVRQMRAEELYESLLVATAADKTRAGLQARETAGRDWLKQFTIAFGTDEGDAGTTFNGTITQMLMLFNGDLMKQAISDNPGGMLRRIAEGQVRFDTKVNYLFQASLARKATRDEMVAAQQLVVLRGGNVTEALQDVWWATLNSNEFILNH